MKHFFVFDLHPIINNISYSSKKILYKKNYYNSNLDINYFNSKQVLKVVIFIDL